LFAETTLLPGCDLLGYEEHHHEADRNTEENEGHHGEGDHHGEENGNRRYETD